MNSQIVGNLFELWSCIGELTKTITKNDHYNAVSVQGSDWPYRVFQFDIDHYANSIEEVIGLSLQGKLPELITIDQPSLIKDKEHLQFLMSQKNMALDMSVTNHFHHDCSNIISINTEKEAIYFAEVASRSFGYKVDSSVVYTIIQHEKIKAFLYTENDQSLGCGILFVDNSNNAGFHMIGTVPEGRGKGIGKLITERLIVEAQNQDCPYCVLHASAMGEPIYKKYGFAVYGEIETYRILKD
ncbi:GNAT family N-acetyltransferase [Flammeovirga sp. SJP92]|uniref:GNAT family N-acetyltransferase n=1 Tax=Flammeovirga sp. SJP92 TaxID=1775430 RepID=UPI001560BE8B|nr:GNAT family N-acetyltransferase [Flammeovirga sp. SJP92]